MEGWKCDSEAYKSCLSIVFHIEMTEVKQTIIKDEIFVTLENYIECTFY